MDRNIYFATKVQLRVIDLRLTTSDKYKHLATRSLEGTFQSSGQQTHVGICNWLN